YGCAAGRRSRLQPSALRRHLREYLIDDDRPLRARAVHSQRRQRRRIAVVFPGAIPIRPRTSPMTLLTTLRESDSGKTHEAMSSSSGHLRPSMAPIARQHAAAAVPDASILLISSSVLEREALSLVLERGGFVVHSAGPDLAAIGAAPASTVVLVEVPN